MKTFTATILTTALLVLFCGCDAPEVKARLECTNNLKHVGLALAIYTQDHDHLIPQDLSAIASSNYFDVSPSVFVCPADKTKRGSKATNWRDFNVTNASYSLIGPGTRLRPDGTNNLIRCPIHQQVAFLQGKAVQTRRESRNP